MRHPLITALAGTVLALTISGCGTPASGTVVGQQHTDAQRTLKRTSTCGPDVRGKYTCGKSKQKWVTEPARWSLVVKTASGAHKTVQVSESEYRKHPVGSTYTP